MLIRKAYHKTEKGGRENRKGGGEGKVKEFICQHIGALIVLVPAILFCLYLSWKVYLEDKFDSMWDGKPWDEAEYQRRVKEWEKEKESR